jgi:hypothetical protein
MFLKGLAAIGTAGRFAGMLAIAPVAFVMTACGFSVTAVLNVIIGAVQGILRIAGNVPWASELSQALATLQQQIATWKSGGPAALIIDALNTIEAIAAVIPLTKVYSPLIDLLVSAIESIITYFQNQGTSNRLVTFTRPRANVNNLHLGRVPCAKPDKLHPTYEGVLKAQWNALADSLQLSEAEIK